MVDEQLRKTAHYRFPGWKLHPLKGEMRGCWSLAVTGYWRLIFRYHEETNTASHIDLIDCHQENAMPMKNPPHPGGLIRTEVVEALGLNISQAAQILNVRRSHALGPSPRQGQAHAGNGPAHRKGVRPRHEPPPPHATRL